MNDKQSDINSKAEQMYWKCINSLKIINENRRNSIDELYEKIRIYSKLEALQYIFGFSNEKIKKDLEN